LKTTDQKPKPQLGPKAHDKPRQAREEAAAQYLTSIKMNNFASIPGTQLLARPWKIAISDSLVPEHFCSARATLANRFWPIDADPWMLTYGWWPMALVAIWKFPNIELILAS
jgi:hypothetical protein